MSDGVGGDRRRGALLRLGLLLALLIAGIVLIRVTPLGDHLSRDGIREGVRALRGSAWAPLVFVAAYAAAVALAIPGTVLTLAGGALFGLFWGVVYNTIAANVGASLAFWLARGLGRDGVERLLGDRLERLDRATRAHGFRGLLTLRLIPLVPFNALNFGAGLTAMRWRTYALATLIGILPGTIVYTMFADALLEGSTEASRDAFVRVLVSGALLVLLAFLPTILRKLNVRLPSVGAPLLALALLAGAGRAMSPPPPSQEASELPALLQALPDHRRFTDVLEEVVVGSRVDYRRLREIRGRLDGYLRELADTDPALLSRTPEPVRLAFWINAYNACMLRQVADHYPIRPNPGLIESVRNAIADRPSNSVWQIEDVFTRSFCPVAGSPRSLDEIEHEIIRPMGDPRIHFVVNCAALSCPPLTPRAYVAERLNRQLNDAVRAFVESPDHFRVDRPGRTLSLNRVLEWYGDDFGGEEGLRRFFAPYLADATRAFVLDPRTDIVYHEYDWTLNDVRR